MTHDTLSKVDCRRAGLSPGMVALLIAGGVCIHLLWWYISEPPTLFSDFYKAYYPAAEHLWENGLRAPWPFTEAGAGGFVNIPLIAWLFIPFVPLGEDLAGWAFLALGIVGVLLAWRCLVQLAGVRLGSATAAALALLVLVNGPMVNSLREGNTTHFILLALAGGLLLLRRNRPFLAGVVYGAIAVVKLPLTLVLAYFLWRRRWRVVAGAAAAGGLICGMSLLIFGLQSHFGWFECCVEPFLRGVIPAFNVQSIDGFIVRLETGASRLREWDPLPRTTWHQLARIASFGVVFGITYLMLRRRGTNDPTRTGEPSPPMRVLQLDVAIMIVLAVVCSPVSWTHYYLLLLLPWALLITEVTAHDADKRVRFLTMASMVLASLPVLDVPEGLPSLVREILARTFISSWLFGGLALLAALLLARQRACHD